MNKAKLLRLILIVVLFVSMLTGKNVSQAVSGSDSSAVVKYNGLSGARQILDSDPTSIISKGKSEIASIYYRDMQSSSNKIIYCMEKGQHNANSQVAGITASPKYNILAYVEIQNGIAKSYIYDDNTGLRGPNVSGYKEANKVLAQILSGEYGLGYGSGVNSYTNAQKALYGYFKEWRAIVGESIGIDSSWDVSNQGGNLGTSTINSAKAAVAAGANPSVKFYLLDNYRENSWQRLMIAEPFENEQGKITLIKQGENGELLANVGFKIKVSPGNLYVRVQNELYTFVEESQATEFYTNSRGRINLDGLPGGLLYTFIETKNPNSGYNLAENLGAKQSRFIEINETCTITVYNKKEETPPEEPGPGPEPEVPTPEKPSTDDIKGSIKISGRVWEDIFGSKSNSIDNEYKEGDKPVQGVIVRWYTSDNRLIDTKTTGSDGKYEMKYIDKYGPILKSSGKLGTGGPFEYNLAVLELISNSYVTFEYNGLKYTTVAQSATGENKSRGIEIKSDRSTLDSYFYEIEKDKVQTVGFNLSISKDENNNNVVNENNWQEHFGVRASTLSIKNLLGTIKENKNVDGRYEFLSANAYEFGPGYNKRYVVGTTQSFTRWCYDYGKKWRGTGATGSDWNESYTASRNDDHNVGQYTYWTGRYEQSWQDTNGDGIQQSDEFYNDTNRPINDTSTIYCVDGSSIWHYQPDVSNLRSYSFRYDPSDHPIKSSEKTVNTDFEIANMNLGLVRLEQPDLALDSDVNRVEVIMKGQKYTYTYNRRGIQNAPMQAEFSNDGKTYTRKINPSDISYVQDKQTTELEVYVTYDIIAKNQSATVPARVGEIVNYYDKDYTLVSQGWTEQSKYGHTYSDGDYKAIYSTALSGEVLQPLSKSSTISVTFRVNDDVVKGLLNRDAQLMNVSEIDLYTALYGPETRCAENHKAKDAEFAERIGTQYASIDIDSIPENAIPGQEGTYEDDTDKAPTFILTMDDNKVISGTVWEDSQTDESNKNNERLGNGTKSDSEKTVQNVKVELLRADENGNALKDENGNEIVADIYIKGSDNLITKKKAVTFTDAKGNYKFEGVVVDYYIIKYTYGNADKGTDADGNIIGKTTIDGNTTINARNYKSTIITTEPIKGAIQGNRNVMWHLTEQNDASVAVDDLQQRINIPELKFSNYDEPYNMSAYSAPFKVQVEYTQEQKQSVVENGNRDQNGSETEFIHDWTIFDFGIVERAREDIVIDKSIANIKITLANGQVLVEGDPRKDNMNYVKALGFKSPATTRQEARNSRNKLLTVELDDELMHGARVDVLYAITVTNQSENDYEYYDGNNIIEKYYYFGEKDSNTKLITPTIDLVVDYMDAELTCTVGEETGVNENNINWQQITPDKEGEKTIKTSAQKLKEMGLISDEVCEKLNQDSYLIFTTDAFKNVTSGGGTHTEYLFASKLLGNQGDDYTFENHAEIVQLNGKIARTIDSTKNGEQIVKTYKPGNYVPSLANNAFEQDDDKIRIVITPPTGIGTDIGIYAIIEIITLMILPIGLYIIKKELEKKLK